MQNIQIKERILRAAKEKGQVTYKGKPIRLIPDFSMETMKARRSWIEVLQKIRDHGCKTTIPSQFIVHYQRRKQNIPG